MSDQFKDFFGIETKPKNGWDLDDNDFLSGEEHSHHSSKQ